MLDAALQRRPRELDRILIHEIFHFVWARLGNPTRLAYEQQVRREIEGRARGELGWSSEWRKSELNPADIAGRTRRWREYVCESFCDTASWLFSGSLQGETTLAATHRERRRRWMLTRLPSPLAV